MGRMWDKGGGGAKEDMRRRLGGDEDELRGIFGVYEETGEMIGRLGEDEDEIRRRCRGDMIRTSVTKSKYIELLPELILRWGWLNV